MLQARVSNLHGMRWSRMIRETNYFYRLFFFFFFYFRSLLFWGSSPSIEDENIYIFSARPDLYKSLVVASEISHNAEIYEPTLQLWGMDCSMIHRGNWNDRWNSGSFLVIGGYEISFFFEWIKDNFKFVIENYSSFFFLQVAKSIDLCIIILLNR